MFESDEKDKKCTHCEVSEETLEALESKKEVYECSECGAEYKKKEWADKCESWCEKHNSRNSKIVKHSI